MSVIPLRRTAAPPAPPGRWHGRLWVTDAQVESAEPYESCLSAHPGSELWPVLIPPDERFDDADWVDREPAFPVSVADVAARDAEVVLAQWWPGQCCGPACLDPVGPIFPGLVRRSSRRGVAEMSARWLAPLLAAREGTRLGLVRAGRSADVPAALGWSGAANHSNDVAALSAVLRSWEDRFGVRLVGLGFDELTLSVDAPPTAMARALGIAAEHRAFCPDGFDLQQGTIEDLARGLLNRRIWRFWWD